MKGWQKGALGALVLAAVVLRVLGMDFGAGFDFHADEWRCVQVAVRAVREPMQPLRFWAYPPALANLVSIPMRLSAATMGDLASQQITGRSVVVLLSVLSCLFAGRAAYRLRGLVAGFFALAVAAFSPLWVEQSRYTTPDLPTAFGVALVALASTHLATSQGFLAYLLSGVAVGVAASFKYIGAFSALLVVCVHLAGPARAQLRAWAYLLAAGAISLATFTLLNFQLFSLGFQPMLAAIQDEFTHYANRGINGYGSDHVYRYVLVYLLQYGLGIGASMALLAGAAASFSTSVGARAKSPAPTRIVTIWPFALSALAWLSFLATRETFFARNLLHVLPLFAVLAGVGFAELWQRSGKVSRALVSVILFLMLVPAWQSTVFAIRLEEPDTRIEAARWMRDNIPKGARIAVVPETYGHYLPAASIHGHKLETRRGYPALERLKGFDYLVISSGQVFRYLRTPQESPEKAGAYRVWHDALTRAVAPTRVFERPLAPGAELFGATADAYHNPRIEIFRLPRPTP